MSGILGACISYAKASPVMEVKTIASVLVIFSVCATMAECGYRSEEALMREIQAQNEEKRVFGAYRIMAYNLI